jgi:hypothetical protein
MNIEARDRNYFKALFQKRVLEGIENPIPNISLEVKYQDNMVIPRVRIVTSYNRNVARIIVEKNPHKNNHFCHFENNIRSFKQDLQKHLVNSDINILY